MKPIDGDALKRRAQKVATEAWKMKIEVKVETILNQFIDWINEAPTIEAEPHWIPCSERLPKQRESVIISVNAKYGNWVGEGCYWETTENHVIWKGYRWNATYWDDEIIAWMPLPEPYRGEDK